MAVKKPTPKKKKGPVSIGTVIKVHNSGMCETDKGQRVAGKFEKGDVLILEGVRVTKKEAPEKPKAPTLKEQAKELGIENTDGMSDADLKTAIAAVNAAAEGGAGNA